MIQEPAPNSIARVPPAGECPPACGQVHSYTADGVRWCLLHAIRGLHAIDVELNDSPPERLRREFRGTNREFWKAWTSLEVKSKLTDVPVLTLVQNGELDQPQVCGLKIRHLVIDDAIVCLGERS